MKYYAVKSGRNGPIIYTNWDDCSKDIKGFSGAKFKSFSSNEEAEEWMNAQEDLLLSWPEGHHICSDASNSIKHDFWEFQLTWTDTKEVIYASPKYKGGTNNTGEFMGLYTAIRYCIENELDCNIYTDSVTAISWVEKLSANMKSNLISEETRKTINDAIKWLSENVWNNKIIHWNNKVVGENPSDYGRK